jgi:hypothetical protein
MSRSQSPAATGVRVLYIAIALLAGAIGCAVPAKAGPYEAIQCARHPGAGHGGFHFSRNSADFHGVRACGSSGLGVTHERSRTQAGRHGMWAAQAPAGTYFARGRLAARGREEGGYSPRLLLHSPGRGAPDPIGSPHRHFKDFKWRARVAADRLIAELTCTRGTNHCGRADSAKIFVKRARFHLFDVSPPAITRMGGALLHGPVQRATQALTLNSHDAGSGVRRVLVRTNGRPFDSGGFGCTINRARQLALSLSPCPNSARNTLSLDTRLPGFHEGQNTIRACVLDYADASPNEGCVRRRLRVDNACPISDVTPELAAHFAFVTGKTAKRVKFGRRPRVVARLVHSSGEPGQGALVCISQRPTLTNSTERLVSTPLRTDARGRVSVRLPIGPSRIVYLTYWRGPEQVVTRALHLRVKPRLGLKVRPSGRLRNGQTMTLRARLRGPFHTRRKVRFLARPPGGRWVPFSIGFTKRTDERGVARAKHTFHHVSGTQRFHFKVTVPHQRRYPYLPGHSRVHRKTVAEG